MNSTLALISGLGLGLGVGLETSGLGLETPGLVNIPANFTVIIRCQTNSTNRTIDRAGAACSAEVSTVRYHNVRQFSVGLYCYCMKTTSSATPAELSRNMKFKIKTNTRRLATANRSRVGICVTKHIGQSRGERWGPRL